MRAALARLQRGAGTPRAGQLEFGVGIHTGDVVAGVMGSDRFMEFTVIGDPVNIAARVEALTRVHQVDILVTDEVMKTLDARFVARAMPPAAVKGKSEPIATFAIEAFDAARARPSITGAERAGG